MSESRKVDLGFVELMLLIIAVNSCDDCNCNTTPPSHKQLERIEGTLNQINDKLDKLPGVGPHP